MTHYQKDVALQFIETVNERHLKVKLMEEMAELTQVLCKTLVDESVDEQLVQELADVELLLFQVKAKLMLSSDVALAIADKQDRFI